MNDSIPGPIPPAVQALLELFATELADVKFPLVDAELLSRSTDEVRAAADQVSRAEAALGAARALLAERQEALLVRAQRALAYARVFAEEDAGLSPRLEAITLPRPRRPKVEPERAPPASDLAAPRRRARTPKGRDTAPALFESEPPAETQGA